MNRWKKVRVATGMDQDPEVLEKLGVVAYCYKTQEQVRRCIPVLLSNQKCWIRLFLDLRHFSHILDDIRVNPAVGRADEVKLLNYLRSTYEALRQKVLDDVKPITVSRVEQVVEETESLVKTQKRLADLYRMLDSRKTAPKKQLAKSLKPHEEEALAKDMDNDAGEGGAGQNALIEAMINDRGPTHVPFDAKGLRQDSLHDQVRILKSLRSYLTVCQEDPSILSGYKQLEEDLAVEIIPGLLSNIGTSG
jgi:hypothetical protein